MSNVGFRSKELLGIKMYEITDNPNWDKEKQATDCLMKVRGYNSKTGKARGCFAPVKMRIERVIESYKNSRKTFFTNIMGTVNFFETVKKLNSVKKIIIFTSDKVYENLKGKVLTEKSHLGGIDPYSASKSCQDIISNSYKSSFFNKKINVTILRAGNIIGG